MTTTQAVVEDKTAPNELAERTGPFYDIPGLIGWLGINKDEVTRRVQGSEILSVVTADGITLFPVWQFEKDGTVNSDLTDVIKTLNGGIRELGDTSGWTVALWLSTQFSGFLDASLSMDKQEKGETLPIYQHLRNSTFIDSIKEIAENDATGWAAY